MWKLWFYLTMDDLEDILRTYYYFATRVGLRKHWLTQAYYSLECICYGHGCFEEPLLSL